MTSVENSCCTVHMKCTNCNKQSEMAKTVGIWPSNSCKHIGYTDSEWDELLHGPDRVGGNESDALGNYNYSAYARALPPADKKTKTDSDENRFSETNKSISCPFALINDIKTEWHGKRNGIRHRERGREREGQREKGSEALQDERARTTEKDKLVGW